MKHDIRRIALAAVIPLFLIFILYLLKFLEVGMDWDFRRLGVYPMEQRGVFGIFAHPLVHGSWKHLLANTLPLLFLMWCLFYFYRHIASYIFFAIWIGCGALTWVHRILSRWQRIYKRQCAGKSRTSTTSERVAVMYLPVNVSSCHVQADVRRYQILLFAP